MKYKVKCPPLFKGGLGRIFLKLMIFSLLIVSFSSVKSLPLPNLGKNQKICIKEKISLNFQDIELRKALQIIADFSKINLICSDDLKGNITIFLQEVSPEEALEIILKSKGLDKRRIGNVLLIGKGVELAARDKMELEMLKISQEIGLMQSVLIPIHYAKAEELANLFLKNGGGLEQASLLTKRGTVSVDKRTNTLLVQDISSKIEEIRFLIKKLDVPVRQVEIATQIVRMDSSLEAALGIRYGSLENVKNPNGLWTDLSIDKLPQSGRTAAKIGLALAKLPNGTLLDLELQALETECKAKTIARPRILTMDQSKAIVEQGVEIPYQEASASGATTISYKTAALKLEVTPHITPDNKIFLDLLVSQDTPGPPVAGPGEPGSSAGVSINTNRLQTKVLVENGETIVLGGILQCTDSKTWTKVPFFGNLPIIGGLFRNRYVHSSPKELIIFLTPQILQEAVSSGCH